MTPPACGTTILGAGPAGLAAALGLAAREPARIIAPTIPAATDPPRVDMVPATFLAFLLELGVHPTQLGVSELHDVRIMAWGSAEPETVRGNAMAHIERPALELALLAAVARLSRTTIVTGAAADPIAPGERVIDATGRRAVSATRTVGLPQPWIARVFSRRGQFDTDAQAFRMAALPAGYAYRLASPRLLTIGVVLSKTIGTITAAEIEAYVRTAGAGWILAGIGRLDSLPPGRGGVASVQWSTGSAGTKLVGDAVLARELAVGARRVHRDLPRRRGSPPCRRRVSLPRAVAAPPWHAGRRDRGVAVPRRAGVGSVPALRHTQRHNWRVQAPHPVSSFAQAT